MSSRPERACFRRAERRDLAVRTQLRSAKSFDSRSPCGQDQAALGGRSLRMTVRGCFGFVLLLCIALPACGRKHSTGPQATAYGTAIVVSSGDKQSAPVGATLADPVVVQVNDAQGTPVVGAVVVFEAAPGITFNPANGLTDSSGQFTTTVSLGPQAGRYRLAAASRDSSGKSFYVTLDEIALGYQQVLGSQLNDKYCARCHNPESTPARVSNFDNLNAKPHPFTEGDTLKKLSDDDLIAIISHGGPAIGRSAEMPPWGYTLSKSDIQALAAYIRAVGDPPYQTKGLVYGKQ
jgi:mono/diheme cytochrome c family protein